MTQVERAQVPTPKFIKGVKTGGLIMTTIGASLLASPTPLSPGLLKLAQYLAIAGSIATAISQVTNAAADMPKTPVQVNGQ